MKENLKIATNKGDIKNSRYWEFLMCTRIYTWVVSFDPSLRRRRRSPAAPRAESVIVVESGIGLQLIVRFSTLAAPVVLYAPKIYFRS